MMRRDLSLLGLVGLLSLSLAASACSGSSSSSSGGGTPSPSPSSTNPAPNADVPQARSDKPRETTPAASPTDVQALTADGRAFATKLFGELEKTLGPEDNFFLSPHSIHTAFGMLYAGAQGSTEAAMKKALGYSLPQDRLHAAMNALDLALESRAKAGSSGSDGKGFRLNVANSLWSQNGFPFQAPYLDTLAVNYGAAVNLVDFQRDTEGATNTINAWIEQKTENRIQKMLSGLSPDTKVVLVNAVYFNAAWQTKFEKSGTAPATFHGLAGDKTVQMMAQPMSWSRYQKTSSYEAVAIPYEGGDTELVAIAPTAGSFAAFESSFDRAAFDAAVDGMKGTEVELSMPKFKIAGDTISLKKALTSLGMGEAFDDGANFQGVTPVEGFHVFDAAHKAFVKVDEDGTEAAAATAISGGTSSLPPEPVKVRLDRPFLFAIRDVPTGAMLFLGRVVAPAE